MLLSEITLPMLWAECKDLALVYSYDVAVLLYNVQEEHGDPRHVPAGRQLTDGRWMLCGDVLSEVGEGGILAGGFAFITPEMMEQIEVIPLADALALLPPESPSPVN
jgi:hypothetical protein